MLLQIIRSLSITTQISLASLRGISLILFVVSISSWHIQANDVRNSDQWIGYVYQKDDLLQVRLLEPPTKKQGFYRSRAEVEGVFRSGVFHPSLGFLWVYFPADAVRDSIWYGSKQILYANLYKLSGPAAPGVFDFRKYSEHQQIYHSVRLKSGQWKCLAIDKGNVFRGSLFRMRSMLLDVISKYVGPETDEAAIAEALVLGFKDDLDAGILQTYSNTGVVHIIAISGMHLALIQLVIVFLLEKIKLHRFPFAAAAFNILALWLFALLTGGSASIIRSAVMFTIMLSGKFLSRDSNTCNTLAASAMLMLLYEPFYLWDAGFVLSHLAVLGLVLLQRPIQGLFYHKNKWIRKLWELNAITLSAQVFTLPYCLYLFRQFPNYFMLGNLLVVPLSSFILIAGLLLISLGWVGPIAVVLGKLISISIHGMNLFVGFVSKLPKTISFFPQFGLLQTILLYLIVISLLLFLSRNSGKMFRSMIVFTLLLCIVSCLKEYLFIDQKKIIFYKRTRGSAIDMYEGPTAYHFSDPLINTDSTFFKTTIEPCRRFFLVESEKKSNSLATSNVIRFADCNIVCIDKGVLPDISEFGSGRNLLLIRNNGFVSIDSLRNLYDPSLVIFDASNKMWKIERWQSDCERLNLRNFSIPHQGALVMDGKEISNPFSNEKNSFGADLSLF